MGLWTVRRRETAAPGTQAARRACRREWGPAWGPQGSRIREAEDTWGKVGSILALLFFAFNVD